jgi:cell division protein FtsX
MRFVHGTDACTLAILLCAVLLLQSSVSAAFAVSTATSVLDRQAVVTLPLQRGAPSVKVQELAAILQKEHFISDVVFVTAEQGESDRLAEDAGFADVLRGPTSPFVDTIILRLSGPDAPHKLREFLAAETWRSVLAPTSLLNIPTDAAYEQWGGGALFNIRSTVAFLVIASAAALVVMLAVILRGRATRFGITPEQLLGARRSDIVLASIVEHTLLLWLTFALGAAILVAFAGIPLGGPVAATVLAVECILAPMIAGISALLAPYLP